MADVARTQDAGGQAPPEPTTIDLDPPGTAVLDQVGALPAEEPTQPDPRDTELTNLRQQNERLRQQVSGSSQEARRLSDENRRTAERLARLEGALDARTQPTPQEPAQPRFTRGQFKSALQKWINGDETDLDMVEEALVRLSDPARTHTPAGPAPLSQEQIEALVNNRLTELGTSEVVRSSVTRAHPEMADSSSPVYGAVWNAYDAYIADQATQIMYPPDPRFQVTIYSPDGTETKTVDARIVRQLASDVKLTMGTRQQTQNGIGQAQGGRGTVTASRQNAPVEALDLLTQAERDEIVSMQNQKAWPSSWPRDLKAAAKHIWDGFDALEKARRLDTYRNSVRTGV